jgi:hypothetical protein
MVLESLHVPMYQQEFYTTTVADTQVSEVVLIETASNTQVFIAVFQIEPPLILLSDIEDSYSIKQVKHIYTFQASNKFTMSSTKSSKKDHMLI